VAKDRRLGSTKPACAGSNHKSKNLIALAKWLTQAAVGLKTLGYSDKGRLHGLHATRYRISPAVS
jgi:hypothetical protein